MWLMNSQDAICAVPDQLHIWIMGIILLLPESGSAHLFLRSDFKRRAVMKQSEYPGWNHPAVSPDRLPVSTCMQWKESSLMREQWRNLLRREGPDKGPSPFFCRPSGAAAAAAGGAESGCRGGGNRHRQSLAAGFRWLGRNVRRVGGVRYNEKTSYINDIWGFCTLLQWFSTASTGGRWGSNPYSLFVVYQSLIMQVRFWGHYLVVNV